jgi:hypothetical protein
LRHGPAEDALAAAEIEDAVSALHIEQRQTDDEYPTTTGTIIDAFLLVKD